MAAAVPAAREERDLEVPQRLAAVVPDVGGIDRTFHYRIGADLLKDLTIGSIVRVPLRGRIVRGWVVDIVDEQSSMLADLELRDIERIVSLGPPASVVSLCRYGSWRYAGSLRSFLASSSPLRVHRSLSSSEIAASLVEMPHADTRVQKVATRKALASAAGDAFSRKCSILRIPPATPRQNVVEAALSHLGDRDVLILVPEHHDAEVLSERLSRLGHRVARMPGEWGKAASGSCVVIGTRNAVFAPMPKTRAILVLDAHAEAYVSERAPTWNATVLAKERGHRAQAPCVFVSACPTLELLAMGDLVTISRADERSGWPAIEILDRRLDDPRSGLYAENLASILRKAVHDDPHRSALCVLNRTGRARLMACGVCGELVCCEVCGAALAQVARANLKTENELVCPSCATRRASFCAKCASLRLKTLRVGVTRAREELAALTGLDVGEITASSARRADDTALRAPVLVGTEAVLHRVSSASLVVFLDFDQELCAPRFRAGEDALALLARAARLVGVRRSGPKASDEKGRIVVQTRLPDHEVLQAARSGDPEVLSAQEALRRASLKLPPAYALALLSGEGAEHLAKEASAQGECEAIGLSEQRFVLRAKHQASIADALAKAAAPPEKVRIEIDPMRL